MQMQMHIVMVLCSMVCSMTNVILLIVGPITVARARLLQDKHTACRLNMTSTRRMASSSRQAHANTVCGLYLLNIR